MRHVDVIFSLCKLKQLQVENTGKVTSTRTFISMLYGCIRRNPAKFLSALFAFYIVGIVIMFAKNVKQN